jgi:hypothetical protein
MIVKVTYNIEAKELRNGHGNFEVKRIALK